jgi:chaperone required for assembly of F1-ATPase
LSGWKAKRFWKAATATQVPGGFSVQLDGKPVKTPAKAAFLLPTLAMAQASAAEWEAQSGIVRPEAMPMTRYANSAIDKVGPQFAAVVDIVAAYGGSDLLCYRAERPADLIARQAQGWDPLLRWSAEALGAPLEVTAGVMHVGQPAASLGMLHAATAAHTPFQLAALHDLVAITGSLVLGLAVARDRLMADAAFDLSRIDEHWQAEQWGQDEDAAMSQAAKRADLNLAARFFRACG